MEPNLTTKEPSVDTTASKEKVESDSEPILSSEEREKSDLDQSSSGIQTDKNSTNESNEVFTNHTDESTVNASSLLSNEDQSNDSRIFGFYVYSVNQSCVC